MYLCVCVVCHGMANFAAVDPSAHPPGPTTLIEYDISIGPSSGTTTEVKILQPDSTFFKVLPGKGRKPDQTDNKAR